MTPGAESGRIELSYSANVHPVRTLDDVIRLLNTDVAAVRDACGFNSPFGLELHLPAPVLHALRDEASFDRLRATLHDKQFYVFSLNAFPLLEDFHAESVKDNVYRPDWTQTTRLDSTVLACRILADLLPEEVEGVVSTSPCSYKPWAADPDWERFSDPLSHALCELVRIESETGRSISLAMEPEPCNTLETTEEFRRFYNEIILGSVAKNIASEFGFSISKARDTCRRHFGLNLDICHTAVEFEDPDDAVAGLIRDEIPIKKVHLSNAIRFVPSRHGLQGLQTLRSLAEPRFLHQTFATDAEGEVVFCGEDLPNLLALPETEIMSYSEIRTHFHAPLFAESFECLESTSDYTETMLKALQRHACCRQFVTETYTWQVLPEPFRSLPLAEGLSRELKWAASRLDLSGNSR